MAYECKAYQPVQEMARFLRRNPPIEAQLHALAKKLAAGAAWLDRLNIAADDQREWAAARWGGTDMIENTRESEIATRLLQLAYDVVDCGMCIRERIEHTRDGKQRSV